MNFFLIAPLGRNNVPAVTAAVCSLLSEKGCGIYAAAPDSGHFPPQVVITDAATVCSQCDMILCIGCNRLQPVRYDLMYWWGRHHH